jgi:hypothetical protein
VVQKNKKMIKKIFIALGIVLILIQFIRPTANKSKEAQANDIGVVMNVPDNVSIVLRKACYDCHSNNTNYPWYAAIQPITWWLNNHIQEGKEELNFSEFGSYTLKRKLKKFNEIADEVTEGAMPLNSYTWMHKDAKLTKEEANAVINWATLMAHKLEQDSSHIAHQ